MVLPIIYFMSRFEDLNASVRGTLACRRLDGGNTLNFLPIGKKIANESRHSDFRPGDIYSVKQVQDKLTGFDKKLVNFSFFRDRDSKD